MGNILFILNDPLYGTERSYNGLRLAGTLVRSEDTKVRVFLMGDAAPCAKKGQQVPKGFYNLEAMIKNVTRHGKKAVSAALEWMPAVLAKMN
ncbi:MAG: DsrE family protein [Nitrospinota bacterium]